MTTVLTIKLPAVGETIVLRDEAYSDDEYGSLRVRCTESLLYLVGRGHVRCLQWYGPVDAESVRAAIQYHLHQTVSGPRTVEVLLD